MRIAVIGAGIVGLATTKALLEDGQHEVRCFESGTPMAARSVGDTRVFRVAHRNESLIELAAGARRAWDKWSNTAHTRLVGQEGLLVNADDINRRVEIMQELGIPAKIVTNTELLAPLTSQKITEPLLHDPQAGVIQAEATGKFLLAHCTDNLIKQTVLAVDIKNGRATVRTAEDEWTCDSVLIAAGAQNRTLAATCGMTLPIDHYYVARFTFRMRDPQGVPPCWFDAFDDMRNWGMTVRPGYWAMGVHWPGEPVGMEFAREFATAATLKKLQEYIAARADQLDPEPTHLVECNGDAGAGDDFFAARNGPVLALWGDNLFKFAPVLGPALAKATAGLAMPALPVSAIP